MGIKKAKTKPIQRLTASELGIAVAPAVTIERVYLPQRSKQTQMIEGSPKEAAAKLVEKLRFEVRVL
jgi:electron transfer flavoprotein beta subunit